MVVVPRFDPAALGKKKRKRDENKLDVDSAAAEQFVAAAAVPIKEPAIGADNPEPGFEKKKKKKKRKTEVEESTVLGVVDHAVEAPSLEKAEAGTTRPGNKATVDDKINSASTIEPGFAKEKKKISASASKTSAGPAGPSEQDVKPKLNRWKVNPKFAFSYRKNESTAALPATVEEEKRKNNAEAHGTKDAVSTAAAAAAAEEDDSNAAAKDEAEADADADAPAPGVEDDENIFEEVEQQPAFVPDVNDWLASLGAAAKQPGTLAAGKTTFDAASSSTDGTKHTSADGSTRATKRELTPEERELLLKPWLSWPKVQDVDKPFKKPILPFCRTESSKEMWDRWRLLQPAREKDIKEKWKQTKRLHAKMMENRCVERGMYKRS
ncbi:unnamed protein product [Amoebophrya sp. A120]|nr:unnamed protein product [Amoebophrya sp. A120]|eukprot:GSA120T00011834001.1